MTEEEEFAKLDPVTASIKAWSEPSAGADDNWHEECRREVRSLMPMLGESLDRLVALMMEFDKFKEENQEALGETEDDLQEVVAAPVEEPAEEPISIFQDDDLNDPVPDFNTATAEEIGARGMRATIRMRNWGYRKENQERRLRESRIREQIVAHLNNRSELGQREIGKMIGVTGGRIAQMVREYYERLDREKE